MPEQIPIDRAFFRESNDGTTVFFPWGLPHRGYRLTGEIAKKKASRAVSLLFGFSIAIGIWTAHALEPILDSEGMGITEVLRALVAPGTTLALVVFSYSLWVSRFVERFPESDLKVSAEERLREAAEHEKPWKVALIGVVVCALSALAIGLQPRAWYLAFLGVLLGVALLAWSCLLKRATADARE